MNREVTYLDLATIDYGECWELQRSLFGELVASKNIRGCLNFATEDILGSGREDLPHGEGGVGVPTASEPGEKGSDSEAKRPRAVNSKQPLKGHPETEPDLETKATQQYILLCEHPPVYTLGKSGDERNMLASEEFLKERGAALYHIERGGDITFHGPGQLVGYPILDLEREGMGLREYIHTLEQTIIDTVAEYGIRGRRVEGAAGVWLTDEGRLRKICAIGVKSSRYVTMHGFALNANTDLTWFGLINPCGFTDRGVTSIALETGESVDMKQLKRIYVTMFEKNFNINIKTEDYANREKLGNQATGRRGESG